MQTATKKETALGIRQMAMIGVMTAVTCIAAPFSIPIPVSPVPLSLTTFILYLSVYILGTRNAFISYVIYLLLGLVGLPVFSGFEGGVGKVAGPTGGYLIGFIFMAIVCGLLMQVKKDKKIVNIVVCVVGMLIGTAIAYAFGTMWFCYSTGTGLGAAMALCVIPFIPGDLIKIAIAAVVAPTVANQIKRI